MIIRDHPNAWRLFFILRGSILIRIRGQLAVTIGLALAVTSGYMANCSSCGRR